MVKANQYELANMGIFSDSSLQFLLDGKPKRVYDVHKDQVYLRPPSEAMLWVFSDKLELVDVPTFEDGNIK